jgi:UDP-glucose 4-epimerase
MTERKRVVVTGAAGLIASLLLPAFREKYDLVLLDVRTKDRAGHEVEGAQVADLLDRDRDAYRRYFRGADAVVHFGFVGSAGASNPFQNELANVQMAYNVYQTAVEEGVRRVVCTSSNHAADYYERLILDHKRDFVYPDTMPLSDNYYGWAKGSYESLGFVFATGRETGRQLENVQIRIGGPRETDLDRCQLGDLTCVRRALAVYISQRDLQQLYVKSLETEDIRDENGVPFQVFYGIGDNSHAFWSIANARKVIGYAPEDNSERRFAHLIAEHLAAAQS